jgi:hypothetical protein
LIIAFSGSAGSGKDTAADYLVKHKAFVKVALADPLKRICKDVFQFTDEQLWGASDRRNVPDKRYPLTPGYGHRQTWDTNRRILESYERENHPDTAMFRRYTEDMERGGWLTPRHALQQLGTEWGRGCYDLVWVEYAMRIAKDLLDHSKGPRDYTPQRGLYVPGLWGATHPVCKGVVISDVRFKNEVEGLRAAGAKVIRILRPKAGLAGAAGRHRSEQEQLEIPDSAFDSVIHNSSTLDELYSEVVKAVGV